MYYHGWDISHETTPPRDKERQYQLERGFIMNKTLRSAQNLLDRKGNETVSHGIRTDTYINPETITNRINEKYRIEKEDNTQLWQQLLLQAQHDFPGATEQRLHAIVYKQIEQRKRSKDDYDPELTLKPDISKSMASKPKLPEKPKRRLCGREEMAATSSNVSGSNIRPKASEVLPNEMEEDSDE